MAEEKQIGIVKGRIARADYKQKKEGDTCLLTVEVPASFAGRFAIGDIHLVNKASKEDVEQMALIFNDYMLRKERGEMSPEKPQEVAPIQGAEAEQIN